MSQAQVDALFADRFDALFADRIDTLFVDRVDTLFANRFDTGSVDRSGTNDTRPPFARVRGHSECVAKRQATGMRVRVVDHVKRVLLGRCIGGSRRFLERWETLGVQGGSTTPRLQPMAVPKPRILFVLLALNVRTGPGMAAKAMETDFARVLAATRVVASVAVHDGSGAETALHARGGVVRHATEAFPLIDRSRSGATVPATASPRGAAARGLGFPVDGPNSTPVPTAAENERTIRSGSPPGVAPEHPV